jgi:hypothetical protein
LVPSARLELAQLSPLPPQDSVSTNFTTTAVFVLDGMRNLAVLAFQTIQILPGKPFHQSLNNLVQIISSGIWPAPEAAAQVRAPLH